MNNTINNLSLVNGEHIFGDGKLIIAGPCTFASYDEIYSIVVELKKLGIKYIRAGAFKPRTNPDSFQGLGDEGMNILIRIKKELDVKIVTELMTINQIKKYGKKIDIIQIGSRNMDNYELLKEAGKQDTPILLKRGMCASYKEWILAANYILRGGNKNIILCERGIKNSFGNETRNILDIQAIPFIKNNTQFPIIVDPSHSSGHAYMVESISKAALTAGADGLIIETHLHPEKSLCDANQTIDIEQLKNIISFKKI